MNGIANMSSTAQTYNQKMQTYYATNYHHMKPTTSQSNRVMITKSLESQR